MFVCAIQFELQQPRDDGRTRTLFLVSVVLLCHVFSVRTLAFSFYCLFIGGEGEWCLFEISLDLFVF